MMATSANVNDQFADAVGPDVAGVGRHVAEGVIVEDVEGRVPYANDVGALAAGFSSVQDLIRASHQPDFAERVTVDGDTPLTVDQRPARLAIEGDPSPDQIVRIADRATRHDRWYSLRANPLFDANGQL